MTETEIPEKQEKRSLRFRLVDILLILMMVLPLVTAVALRVLLTPPEEGVAIHGAWVYWCANPDADLSQVISTDFMITEAQVNSWLVMISITGLALFLTHGLRERAATVRQHVAEWVVEKVEGLVTSSMGAFHVRPFAPFVCAIIALSVFSSLMSLLGVFTPTSDMSVVSGWAILVFLVITAYKACCGPRLYVKTFTSDGPVVAVLNVIGEVATPVSMAFRHYGNVMSGAVISVLMASFLRGLSMSIFGGISENFPPILQIGIPGVLSIYFDVFSGGLQAFIFAMLTMLNLGGAFPLEDWLKRHGRKKKEAVEQIA